MSEVNDHLVLVSGKSATGKSASLMGLAFNSDGTKKSEEFQKGVLYACTEAGKKLPFPNKFTVLNIIDPLQIYELFEHAEQNADDYHTIAIDSATFLMDQFETQYVFNSSNTMQG